MEPTIEYLQKCRGIISTIESQQKEILIAAQWCAKSIMEGRITHVFGSGHSRIMTEEMWPRYGSFPGFNPIVELSLSFHNLVVGANGQRQAMFLENVSGFASRILRNFDLSPSDTAIVISSSGCNVVPVEMAEEFHKNGIHVVAIVSKNHLTASNSKRKDGKKLTDFASVILDTGAPIGDSMITISGLETPVAPGSTVGGVVLINCIKAEIAKILMFHGIKPTVLTSAVIVGETKAAELFENAYDEHAHLISKLYASIGNKALL